MDAALGMLEVTGYVAAVEFTDVMLKAANIQLVTVQKTRGMGWMSVFITGDVGAVQAAIAAAKAGAIAAEQYVTSQVIPRPGKGLAHLLQTTKKQPQQSESTTQNQPIKPPAKQPAASHDTKQPKIEEKSVADTTPVAKNDNMPKQRSRSKQNPTNKTNETLTKK